MTSPRTARPIGVILAAILLGFIAAAELVTGGLVSLASLTIGRRPIPATAAAPAPPAQVLAVVLVVLGFIIVLLAVWAIVTLIGLVRLKNWARYSVLVMGGLLTFFGLTSVASLALLPAIMAAGPQTQFSPHVMQGMLLSLGLFYAAIAGVGIWWLVYFNLRTVKAYFLPQYAAAMPYPTAASLATPGGLEYPAAWPAPLPPPPAGRFAHVPTSIKVIACFFFFAALNSLVILFLPFPAFMAGFMLSGALAKLLYLAIGALMLLIGLGLIRLDNRARLAVYGVTAFGLVNGAAMLTPWGRARFVLYNEQLRQTMHLPSAPAALSPANSVFMVIGLVFSLVFYVVILYLIERHRTLFQTPGQAE